MDRDGLILYQSISDVIILLANNGRFPPLLTSFFHLLSCF